MRSLILVLLMVLAVPAFAGDVYFCPMRCEGARTYDKPVRCPVCGMKLDKKAEAAVPPMNSREYRVDYKAVPQPKDGKPVALSFHLKNTKDDSPIKDLEVSHEKPMHLIVVSQDLSWFSHEHPAVSGPGELKLDFTFPRAGNHVMYADFTPKGGEPQVVPLAIQVEGKRPKDVPLKETRGLRKIDGYEVTLKPETPLAAGKTAVLGFLIKKGGKPVVDLAPYLGAGGHLVVVSEDTTRFLHAHTVGHNDHAQHGQTAFGPRLAFAAAFPRSGLYKAWLQFSHDGKLVTADFVVRVKN